MDLIPAGQRVFGRGVRECLGEGSESVWERGQRVFGRGVRECLGEGSESVWERSQVSNLLLLVH